MKQNDILLLTMAEALAALVQRVGDVEGVARIAGPQGEKGDQGIQGETGPAPTPDELIAALNQIIASDPERFRGPAGKNGKPGREPTSAEIETAVDLWMAFNAQTLKGKDGRNGIDGATGTDGQDGQDGRDGSNGANGRDGIGIELVEQISDETVRIVYGGGKETEIELPKPKRTTIVGSIGGVGSGGGESQQEVFITDTPPAIAYPAINYLTTPSGLYIMQVNVP